MKKLFNLDLQKRWGTFSIYEKFEHLIISLLTAIIAAIVGAATWQLILHTSDLVRSHLVDPRDSQVFQSVFGMVLTLAAHTGIVQDVDIPGRRIEEIREH